MANARRAIEEKIGKGEYYDAQQMVKTVYRRLCARGQIPEASELCVESARRFNDAGEHELAADLGKDLVTTFEDAGLPPCEEPLAKIEAIFNGIPPAAARTIKYAMLQQALRWSSSQSEHGHPRLHRLAAKSYWAEHDYGKCQGHFVYCADGAGLAGMVREWSLTGYPNEADLFALRTLLILLSLNDIPTARAFWDTSVGFAAPCGAASACSSAGSTSSVHAAVPETGASSLSAAPAVSSTAKAEEQPSEMSNGAVVASPVRPWTPSIAPPEPPVQCGSFLLAASEAGNIEFFRMVRQKYTLVFRRDSSFDKYLDEIEARVFNASMQRGGLGALFEALLGGGGPM